MGANRILVVDDTGFNRILVEKYLTSAGYRAVGVQSAEEAMKKLSVSRFDLVIADYFMPEMDGLQLFKKVKKTRLIDDYGQIHTPPFILCTANQDKEALQECIQEGFYDVILKPVERERLLDSVKKALAGYAHAEDMQIGLSATHSFMLKTMAEMVAASPKETLEAILELLSLCEYGSDVKDLDTLKAYLRKKMVG